MRARYSFAALGVIAVAAAAALAAAANRSGIAAVDAAAVGPFAAERIARGAQLAVLGNCNTCHTTTGGSTYAGGRALRTPFGTVYSTNITPDPQTGIGRWPEAAFVRAMREGVDREGRHLYPAFPYDHFRFMEETELQALYAFFMSRDPVSAQAPANELVFPFNLRPLIAAWKWLFLHDDRNEPQQGQSPEFNRGAHLVQGLAHCGGCHTPRNLLGAEKRDRALSGGTIEGWHAPAINAQSPSPKPWSAGELYLYLRHGLAPEHAIPAGPMHPVVHNLAAAHDDDVRAIAVYVGALMNQADAGEREQRLDKLLPRARGSGAPLAFAPTASSAGANLEQGAALYAGACAACHARGRGLATAEDAQLLPYGIALNLDTPGNLLRIIVEGIAPAPGEHGRWMPAFGAAFSDDQLAALAAYLRAAFTTQPPWADLADEARRVMREHGAL